MTAFLHCFCLFWAQHICQNSNALKQNKNCTMLLQIWKHPLLLLLMWKLMCLNCILLKSLDEIGELMQKIMTLMDWPPKCKMFVDGSKINEPYKNLMIKDVCDCKNGIWHGTLLRQLPWKMWCISTFQNV